MATPTDNQPTFVDVDEKLTAIKTLLAELTSVLKVIEKSSPKKRPKTKKVEKPRPISKGLATFMKLSEPSSSREGVLRAISKHVHDKKLQDVNNKREFLVDKPLSQLLKLKTGTRLTFLAINKHISHLFLDTKTKK